MKPWKTQKGDLVPITDIPADGLLYDIGHKTRASRFEDGHWFVYHYLTQIIYFANEYVILDAGGFRSDVTRKRLDFYCGQHGVYIKPEDKGWFVYCEGYQEPFKDGMRVNFKNNPLFDMSGCTEDIESIKLRDKVLDTLWRSLEKTGKMPYAKSQLVAQNARFINPASALKFFGHDIIFRDFSLKCHQTLPTMINILKEVDDA